MAITTVDGLIGAARQRVRLLKTASITTIATIPFSSLDVAGTPGAGSLAIGNTTAGLVPTDATNGYPTITAFGGGATGYLQSVEYGSSVASRVTLYDRLWNSGSHALTPLRTDTITAPPSYATRLPGTDYTGLEIFVEVSVVIPASAVTITVNYINEDTVTAGVTASSGSLSGFTTRRLVPLPLQAGHKGVSRITSVVVGGVAAATGSINVVVARRLWSGRVKIANDGALDGPDATGMPVVYDNSALWMIVAPDGTAGGIQELGLTVANG